MKTLFQGISLFIAGIACGWWLHHAGDAQVSRFHPTEPFVQHSSISPVSIPEPAPVQATQAQKRSSTTKAPTAERFYQLLIQQQFKQALTYYEQALLMNDEYRQLLRPQLEAYLQTCLERCSHAAVINLVNLWLGAYYEDISVMLFLADSQRLQGLSEESASTLQIAATYALTSSDQAEVISSIERLVAFTDESLSRQQRWIELLGFYEFLDTIDLNTPSFQLRQAQLYQLVDEPQRSHQLLVALRDADDGLNSQWTATLDEQLAKGPTAPQVDSVPNYAIPVTPLRDHFIVASAMNRDDQLNLIIDTGASMTTLTSESFARIDHAGFRYIGSRLFNTANGLTQGEVYRVESISLGEISIENLEIAVLDYGSAEGVDGLLGMNVLRNFRFEIDQDKELLYLRPRMR